METAGKVLLMSALILAIVGQRALGLAKLGVDRVPGTLSWKSDNVTVSTYLGWDSEGGREGRDFLIQGWVGERRLSLPAGSFAFGPKGVPHTFIAETDGAKALIGFQPFHFEGFLREVGEPATERVLPPPLEAPPDMERLLPIAERNGMDILGPPGPPPAL